MGSRVKKKSVFFYFNFEIKMKVTFVRTVTGNIQKKFGWIRIITERSNVLNFWKLGAEIKTVGNIPTVNPLIWTLLKMIAAVTHSASTAINPLSIGDAYGFICRVKNM